MTLAKISFSLLLWGWVAASFGAMEFKEADITTVKNIVERNEGSGAVPAKVSDKITENSMVSTAAASMAELTFADSSITRMGSNTQFSFKSKERLVKLEQGTVLIHTPPGNGGATVDAGGVTAAVSGTTFMASRDASGNAMFVLLEGQGGLKVTVGGSSVVIRPGQAASVGADAIQEAKSTASADASSVAPAPGTAAATEDKKSGGSGQGPAASGGGEGGTPPPAASPKIQVFEVDVKKVVASTPLIVEFKSELPSAAKIEKTIETQQVMVKEGKLESLGVEVVAVKSKDGDPLVGAPKVEKEEMVVVNKKTDLVGQGRTGGGGMDIETAAGPGTGGGGVAAAPAPAPRAEVPAPPPASSVNLVPPVISQVASQVSTPPSTPTSLQLAFANGIGTVTLDRAALQTTTVSLAGFSGLPASVIIPAGSRSVSFALPPNPQDFFPGFADPANPSTGYQPLAVTAGAGSLSASANAVNGWFDFDAIRRANPARQMIRTGMMNAMEANEMAALDAFFYFRNAVAGGSMNFYDSVRTRPLNLSTLNLTGSASPAVQSLAGGASASKDYVFGASLISHGSVPTAPINLNLNKPETVFFADQIRLGATSLAGGGTSTWIPLASSTTSWDVPDGNAAGDSQQINAVLSYGNLPLAVRLNLKISPLLTDSTGADFYLGDFSASLRHTTADGEARTVRLFDRIGATALDPSGSPANGLDVVLSDWEPKSSDINLQDTAGVLTGPLTGTYRPGNGGWPSSLNDLASIDPNGKWTLSVVDNSSGASGRVESWSLEWTSVFQPQHTISLSVPTVGTQERLVTFASGANGTQLLSTRWLSDGAGVEFVSSGPLEMRQTQFENLGKSFSVEAAGKVKMGAGPAVPGSTAAAPDPQTIDSQQVRIMANTVTGSGGQQVPAPGSLAVIRSGDSLELRNVTIRSFAGAQLETVSGGTTTARVLMSGSSVRDFKIKELVGAAVNADSKIQMAVLDAQGGLDGEILVEKGLPVATQLAKQLDITLSGPLADRQVHAHQVDLAARTVKFNEATVTAMNAITARANTVLIQNSFMTVVQSSGMINLYVRSGLVNQNFGTTVDGRVNFAGSNTFQFGNVTFNISSQADLNGPDGAYGTKLFDTQNGAGGKTGAINVLSL